MAAPLANKHNVTHGLRMQVSAMPNHCQFISAATYKLRSLLEAWALDRWGEVDLLTALHIQTAVKFEQTSALAMRWLRLADGSLTHAERIAYAKLYSDASAKRDATLKAMGMDRQDQADLWGKQIEALYATPALTHQGGNGDGTVAAGGVASQAESDGDGPGGVDQPESVTGDAVGDVAGDSQVEA